VSAGNQHQRSDHQKQDPVEPWGPDFPKNRVAHIDSLILVCLIDAGDQRVA